MGLGHTEEMKITVVVTPRKACPELAEGRGSTSGRKQVDSRSPASAEDKLRGNDRHGLPFRGARMKGRIVGVPRESLKRCDEFESARFRLM
jgi:hypothetical protein